MALLSKIISDKAYAADAIDTSVNGLVPVGTVDLLADLPMSNNDVGIKILVLENNTIYLWAGRGISYGWYPLVMLEDAPIT